MNRGERRRERERAGKYVRRTAQQVAKWVEFTDARQKGTAPSYLNMEADVPPPGSSVPYAAWLERFYSEQANRDAATHLIPLLQDMARKCPADYTPFFRVERNPTLLRQWRAGATKEDQEWAAAFDYACRLAARRLYNKTKDSEEGPAEIRVVVNPEDEEAKSIRAYSEKQRRIGTEDSMRTIAEEVRAAMREQECGVEAAKGLVADRTGRSFSRVEKAWLFSENERRAEE